MDLIYFRFVGCQIAQKTDQDIDKNDQEHDQAHIEPKGTSI